MARFSGTHKERFSVAAPADIVLAHFADLKAIARNYGPIERADILDDVTLSLLLQEKGMSGVRYQARYTVRYERDADSVRWRTIASENLWSSGEICVIGRDPNPGGSTQLDYTQHIETEIPVPRLLAKLADGIVRREIVGGVQAYLQRMRDACPRG